MNNLKDSIPLYPTFDNVWVEWLSNVANTLVGSYETFNQPKSLAYTNITEADKSVINFIDHFVMYIYVGMDQYRVLVLLS